MWLDQVLLCLCLLEEDTTEILLFPPRPGQFYRKNQVDNKSYKLPPATSEQTWCISTTILTPSCSTFSLSYRDFFVHCFCCHKASISHCWAPPPCSTLPLWYCLLHQWHTLTALLTLINDYSVLLVFCTATRRRDVLPNPKARPCLEDLAIQIPTAD